MLNIIHNAIQSRTKRKKVHGVGTYSTNNRGFSLIELIIIIAIMAVLIAVLVPSLIKYTENSRAQKDESTMDEVVNAVQLAMSDQNCFDEMLLYACDNNFITYSDSSGKYGQQIIDGEYWAPDGYGRATTITLNPEKNSQGDTIYKLENAIVNDMTYGNGSVAENRIIEGERIETNQCYLPNAKLSPQQDSGYLYNRVRQTIGNDVITTSATYANSSFTIFIRFTQKDGVTVADVNGAFNGTNLDNSSSASVGSGTNSIVTNPNTGEKEQGSATTPNGGTTNVNFGASALSGSGTFGGVNNEYKTDHTNSETSSYYLSIYDAIEAINNSTVGESAVSKADGSVYVYMNGNTYNVVLMSNTVDTNTVNVKTDVVLNLNGKIANYNGELFFNVTAPNFTIDGTKSGSKVNVTMTTLTTILLSTKSGTESNVVIDGGEYVVTVSDAPYTSQVTKGFQIRENSCLKAENIHVVISGKNAEIHGIWSKGTVDIINSKVEVSTKQSTGDLDSLACCIHEGVFIANNCQFIANAQDGRSYGFYSAEGALDCKINNCTIAGNAHAQYVNDQITNGGYGITIWSKTSNNAKYTISNSQVYGSHSGLITEPSSNIKPTINIDNCTIEGLAYGMICGDASISVTNSITRIGAPKNEATFTSPSDWKKALITVNATKAINLNLNNIICSNHYQLLYVNQTRDTSTITLGQIQQDNNQSIYCAAANAVFVITKDSNVTTNMITGVYKKITQQ